MGEIQKQAVINATPQAVFSYVSNAHNAPNFISAITRIISGPEGVPQEGQTWRAEANFLGQKNLIDLRLSQLVPDRLVRISMLGEPSATMTLRFHPMPDSSQTEIGIHLDAPSAPTLLLGLIMGGMLEGDLARLKRIMESAH